MVVRRQRRLERGNALTLAVIIVLAMIGLGLLAIRSTRQNLAGSGNLRMNKQARYIAEMALYEAVTYMNLSGNPVFAQRPAGTSIVLKSDGVATFETVDGNAAGNATWVKAGLLDEEGGRPNPLGQFGDGSGLVGSFEVTVDGFREGAPTAGSTPPGPNDDWKFCQMEFTARAYIADVALPDRAALNSDEGVSRFAEHTMRAGVVLRVSPKDKCGS